MTNLDGTFSSPLQAHVLDNIAGDTPAIRWSELKDKWPHLRQVPFKSVSRWRQIDIVIGSDHPVFHHVLKKACGDQPNDPIARLTNLGWVCFGPTLVEEFRRNTHSHFMCMYRSSQVNKPPPPDDILPAFWELESLGIMDKSEQRMTAEERAAVAQVSETLEVRNGRYKIGIPWKEGEPKFTNNYDVAIVRLKSQEKSLKRKGPEVMEAYNKILQDYEKKDYIRQVPQSEVEKQWFLSHFPVVKEDRVTTKVCVVFDAAAKHHGKSLNDAIWPGPKLQRDLVDVLTRFRRAPVALSADISEMFLQVELQEKDRPYHRFLWRDFNTSTGTLPSKNAVRRAINKIKAELTLIEKIVASLKEVYALNEIAEADTIIESLQESLTCMSFSDCCLETLLCHFVPSMFFRPMPRHTL